jgi:hypothetical protein
MAQPLDREHGKTKEIKRSLAGGAKLSHMNSLKREPFPGFDESAWQSQNRSEYLGDGLGNDSLGYDFCFKDVSGRLTGHAGTVCMLEVKSSPG